MATNGANITQEAIAACKGEQATNESEQGANNNERRRRILPLIQKRTTVRLPMTWRISTSIVNTERKQIE